MMNQASKYAIILFCLLSLTSCQQSSVMELSQLELNQLTDQKIIQINQMNCEQQDHQEMILQYDHPLQIRVNKLTYMFPQVINDKKINYRIYLNTQPNAWSSLNGCIRLNSGLMKILDDNEIQAVIAHEIGHIALNHSIESFRQAKSAELKSNCEITLVVPSSLSQQQEFEADNYAIILLKQHNINSNGLISMLDKLNHHQKLATHSHPDIATRKKNLFDKINH